MNKKQNCKYYDKYENACRISSCSCGATLRECEDDSDSLVDVIVTGASIAVGLGNLFDSDSSSSSSSSDDNWSGGGGDSGGGGSDSSW